MQRAESFRGKWWNLVFLLTALAVVAADQLSKLWVRSYPEQQVIFDVGWFRIIHAHNTGAAFGLFQGHSFALTIVGLVAIAVILLYTLFLYRRFPILGNKLGKSAVGLVVGGTAGNLIDRLHLGYVTDFIDFGFWPAFNIADSAIVIGAIILAYSLLPLIRTEKQ